MEVKLDVNVGVAEQWAREIEQDCRAMKDWDPSSGLHRARSLWQSFLNNGERYFLPRDLTFHVFGGMVGVRG